jgi:hypothetical protein
VVGCRYGSLRDVLKAHKKKLHLQRPCPGSAYQTLFDPKAAVTSVRPSFYSAQDYQYS